MRSNKWNLVWAVIGTVIIVMTFVNNSGTKIVFGLELDIWVYRGLWSLITVASFVSFLKRKKEEAN
jgi:hypothetical protein|tara:strand:- start:1636 stop:1833 length:198 start_codon:yes stop_codon:yes gene_type:complete